MNEPVWKHPGSGFRLRVMTPEGGLAYSATATSAPAEPTVGGGVETFVTDLPIMAGQTVGLDMEDEADVGTFTTGSIAYSGQNTGDLLPEGQSTILTPLTFVPVGFEYDAVVLPPPTVTG